MGAERRDDAAISEGGTARALQLRLYREIGLSAVALALECAKLLDEPVHALPMRHTAATFESKEQAA